MTYVSDFLGASRVVRGKAVHPCRRFVADRFRYRRRYLLALEVETGVRITRRHERAPQPKSFGVARKLTYNPYQLRRRLRRTHTQ